jgi:hypothetical protein
MNADQGQNGFELWRVVGRKRRGAIGVETADEGCAGWRRGAQVVSIRR